MAKKQAPSVPARPVPSETVSVPKQSAPAVKAAAPTYTTPVVVCKGTVEPVESVAAGNARASALAAEHKAAAFVIAPSPTMARDIRQAQNSPL